MGDELVSHSGRDIGVDLDGVCYDLLGAYLPFARDNLGAPVTDQCFTPPTYDFWKAWGWDLPRFLESLRLATEQGELFVHGEELPGTREGLNLLNTHGYRIHLVSARGGAGWEDLALAQTRDWLRSAGLRYDTLTLTHTKTDVPTDFFIDDNPSHLKGLSRRGTVTFLMDATYNRDEHHPRRVRSVLEFAREIVEGRWDALQLARDLEPSPA